MEAKYLDRIEQYREEMIRTLQELIAFPKRRFGSP
jgi:hypothetical protein